MALVSLTFALISAEVTIPVCGQSTSGRTLAKGVIQTIPAQPTESETHTGPRPIVELVPQLPEWEPNYAPTTTTLSALARGAVFHHPVWQLEFRFKPVRTIQVDMPATEGSQERRLIWYLLYEIRNPGSHLRPVKKVDASGNTVHEVVRVDHAVRCFPSFVVKSLDHDVTYFDQVIPVAVEAIHAREIRDPAIHLHNTVEISSAPIEVSTSDMDHGVWGVATWDRVDPRTDFLAVFIQGLSNAYQWEDPAGAFKPGDPPGTGSLLTYKTLQLNFWRPGDTIREQDDRIVFGMPDNVTDDNELARILQLYGVETPQSHRWFFLP
jgi:hypothetical protein